MEPALLALSCFSIHGREGAGNRVWPCPSMLCCAGPVAHIISDLLLRRHIGGIAVGEGSGRSYMGSDRVVPAEIFLCEQVYVIQVMAFMLQL